MIVVGDVAVGKTSLVNRYEKIYEGPNEREG